MQEWSAPMKWLARRDTRHARWLILRLRMRALRYGDDWQESYLAIDATLYGIALLLPGRMLIGPQWQTIAQVSHGDVGLGVTFAVLAVGLWLSALRLLPCTIQRILLVTTLAVWVAMSVGFLAHIRWWLGFGVSLLNALTAWVAYLRTDE